MSSSSTRLSVPALYFLSGSRTPSPPPFHDLSPLLPPLPPLLLTSSSPLSSSPSVASFKPPKRKASRPLPISEDLQRPPSLPRLQPTPASPSPPSRWSHSPPFLASLLLPFLSGPTLATLLHLSSTWRIDLTPPSPSPFSSHPTFDLDLPLPSADPCDDPFTAFSTPPSLPLSSLFACNLAHTVHTLHLSSARLTPLSLTLLSSLLFLSHLTLRLFHTVPLDWYTDFLTTHPTGGAGVGMDSFYSGGGGWGGAECSGGGGGWEGADRMAAAACARGLRGCVRRLCHLRSLRVVDFVDEVDSDDFPVLSALSEAVIDALRGHPHLEELQLERPRFTASPLFATVLTAERLRSISQLQAVQLIDAMALPQLQRQALMQCPQLTDVRITQSEEGVEEGAASQLLAVEQLTGLSSAWPQLRVLIAQRVHIGEAKPDALHAHSKAFAVSSSAALSQPSSPSSTSSQVCSLGAEAFDCVSNLSRPVQTMDVSVYFTALTAFRHLTTLHLSFVPRLASPFCPISSFTFGVDPEVWAACWNPTSSPFARSLLHLTIPTFPTSHMSLLLTLPHLLTLHLFGASPSTDDFLSVLTSPSPTPSSLTHLRVALSAEQVEGVRQWVERLARGVERTQWAALEEVEGVSCEDEERVFIRWNAVS